MLGIVLGAAGSGDNFAMLPLCALFICVSSGNVEAAQSSDVTTTSAADAKVYSPNLLTIGLSKGTLGRLGFRFKEDISTADDRTTEVELDRDHPRG